MYLLFVCVFGLIFPLVWLLWGIATLLHLLVHFIVGCLFFAICISVGKLFLENKALLFFWKKILIKWYLAWIMNTCTRASGMLYCNIVFKTPVNYQSMSPCDYKSYPFYIPIYQNHLFFLSFIFQLSSKLAFLEELVFDFFL